MWDIVLYLESTNKSFLVKWNNKMKCLSLIYWNCYVRWWQRHFYWFYINSRKIYNFYEKMTLFHRNPLSNFIGAIRIMLGKKHNNHFMRNSIKYLCIKLLQNRVFCEINCVPGLNMEDKNEIMCRHRCYFLFLMDD